MKKGTCKRFMAMAMSLVTALGTGFGGGVQHGLCCKFLQSWRYSTSQVSA